MPKLPPPSRCPLLAQMASRDLLLELHTLPCLTSMISSLPRQAPEDGKEVSLPLIVTLSLQKMLMGRLEISALLLQMSHPNRSSAKLIKHSMPGRSRKRLCLPHSLQISSAPGLWSKTIPLTSNMPSGPFNLPVPGSLLSLPKSNEVCIQ